MYRDRIHVRPAFGRPSASAYDGATSTMASDDGHAYAHRGASVSSFASSVDASHRGEATEYFAPHTEEGGDGLRYARRIARLACDTVGSLFSSAATRSAAAETFASDAAGASESAGPLSAAPFASPAAPPNTPFTAPSHTAAAHADEEMYGVASNARAADTIDRRRPRASAYSRDYEDDYDNDYGFPVTYAPPRGGSLRVADVAAAPRVAPVRQAPQYQLTINQYFAAPQPSAYPVVATAAPYPTPRLTAAAATSGYQPRVSLLTVPSAIRQPAKRERSVPAEAEAKALEAPAAKAVKKAAPATVHDSDISLSNAPSAIPLNSPENSLTVPISLTASSNAPLFGKAKAAEETAAPAKPKPTVATTTAPPAAPLFGAKPAAPAAPAFTFGAKTATTAAPTTTTTTKASPPAFGGFVKQGPPAVIADDDGFAPNASDDDDDDKKDTKNTTAPPPSKPAFSFNASGLKPAFGGAAPAPTTTTTAAPPANPFSFSPKPAEKTAGAPSAPSPTTAAAPKVNSFVKAGPAAVMPDDSGFAPGADSDDDDKAPAKAPAPKSLGFSFTASGATPAFGSGTPSPTTTTTTTNAAPASKPFGTGASFTGGFVKSGPTAVMPDDSGFAPNADKDDDDDGGAEKAGEKKARPDSGASPASGVFSFSASSGATKPAFGSGAATFGSPSGSSAPLSFGLAPTSSSEAPANPFKFSTASTTGASSPSPFGSSAGNGAAAGASPFGSGASSPFGTGASSTFTFGKAK